jgi:ferredoxin-like protein FixX
MWKKNSSRTATRSTTAGPHIKIRQPELCRNECKSQSCTYVCPAACYKAEGNGAVTLITDGCLECGSCRIICTELSNVEWEYPAAGTASCSSSVEGHHGRSSSLSRPRHPA